MADLYNAWSNSGPADRQKDEQESVLRQLSSAEALGRIAQQPAQMRLTNATAAAAEFKLSNEQQLQKIAVDAANKPADLPALDSGGNLVNPAGDALDGLAKQLTVQALAQSKKGFVKQAQDTAEKLSLIESHRAAAAASTSKATATDFATEQKQLGIAVGLLEEVKNAPPGDRQRAWDRSHAMFTLLTGKRSSFADLPYSEENLKLAEGSVLSAKDQMELDDKDQNRALTAARDADRKTYQDAQVKINEYRAATGRLRLDAMRKAGDAAAKFPSRGELDLGITAVTQYMNDHALGELPAEQLTNAAADVIGDAKQIIRSNPGISTSMAMEQALAKNMEKIEKGDSGYLGTSIGSTDPHYGKTAKSTGSAIALPASGKREDLVTGQQYTDSKGATKTWDGTKFVGGK